MEREFKWQSKNYHKYTKEEGLTPARLSSLESQRNAEKRKMKNEGVSFHT